MRVCFLSFTHPFDDMRILHKEAYSLARAGHEVIHLAPGDMAPAEVGGVRILLYPRASVLRRAWLLLRHGYLIEADVYHCNEVQSWLIGLVLKLVRPRARVVFDVHEHYPSRFAELVHYPRWLRRPSESVLRILFRVLTPVTDFLIFAKRSVVPDFPVHSSQAACVFNYSAARFSVPSRESVPPAVHAHFASGFVAIHLGYISRVRGWPQLLEALTQLPAEVRVISLGEVVEGVDTLMAEARRLGVADRVTLLDQVPYETVFQYLVWADCGLMLYQPGIQNHVFAFPMKMYDYMQAGLPLIGPDFAVEVAPVFNTYGCGILIDTSDAKQLADALARLLKDRDARQRMAAASRYAAQTEFTWEAQERNLLNAYAKFDSHYAAL